MSLHQETYENARIWGIKVYETEALTMNASGNNDWKSCEEEEQKTASEKRRKRQREKKERVSEGKGRRSKCSKPKASFSRRQIPHLSSATRPSSPSLSENLDKALPLDFSLEEILQDLEEEVNDTRPVREMRNDIETHYLTDVLELECEGFVNPPNPPTAPLIQLQPYLAYSSVEEFNAASKQCDYQGINNAVLLGRKKLITALLNLLEDKHLNRGDWINDVLRLAHMMGDPRAESVQKWHSSADPSLSAELVVLRQDLNCDSCLFSLIPTMTSWMCREMIMENDQPGSHAGFYYEMDPIDDFASFFQGYFEVYDERRLSLSNSYPFESYIVMLHIGKRVTDGSTYPISKYDPSQEFWFPLTVSQEKGVSAPLFISPCVLSQEEIDLLADDTGGDPYSSACSPRLALPLRHSGEEKEAAKLYNDMMATSTMLCSNYVAIAVSISDFNTNGNHTHPYSSVVASLKELHG